MIIHSDEWTDGLKKETIGKWSNSSVPDVEVY